MSKKVWLSNVSIEDAGKIEKTFLGVSVGLPKAAGGLDAKALCQEGVAGLYATEERAKELGDKIR